MSGLTVTGAFSVLDTEITRVITPTNDVTLGDSLAYAHERKANLRARYEWSVGSGMIAHVMPQIAYSAASYSDIVSINRDKLNSWTLLGFSAGVTSDTW